MSIFPAMKKTRLIRAAAIAATLMISSSLAGAQEPKEVGKFGDWIAYSYDTNSGPVCFIASQPQNTTISRQGARRGDIFFLVTHRPGDKTRNVAQAMLGYPLKRNETVKLTIDSSEFDLFADQEDAFAGTKEDDQRIILTMKKGSKMVVTGESQRGTKTTDTYSLAGVTAAMDKIDGICE